jgi:hypothetical protein
VPLALNVPHKIHIDQYSGIILEHTLLTNLVKRTFCGFAAMDGQLGLGEGISVIGLAAYVAPKKTEVCAPT